MKRDIFFHAREIEMIGKLAALKLDYFAIRNTYPTKKYKSWVLGWEVLP